MQKKYFFLFFFLLLTAQAFSQSIIQNISSRHNLSLNGKWNYIIDPYENGFYDYRRQAFDQSETGKGGFYDDVKQTNKGSLIEYDFDHDATLDVPGDWNSQAPELKFYEGSVWYRRHFNFEPKQNKRYIIYFAAANYETHVYLNGKKLGMHKGGFTPFQFEVTGKLKNGENSIVVKVDNTRKQDEIPTINTDWWNYGGLTADVYLSELPETYIDNYKVQLAKGNLKEIEGFVQLSGNQKSQSVAINIPEAKLTYQLKTDTSGYATFKFPVKNLKYWSPESPKLYQVTLQTETDKLDDKIGFRTIETRGKDVLLNGKSVFLRGIAIHNENPLIPGRPRSEGDLRMLLNWAKELNCNYVRLAHYPHNEKMLRLADEMGLMVWAEVPVYWTISWENPATYQNAQKQLTDLIDRDKNRAAVIIWSVGNETPISQPRNKFMGDLIDKAHELDHTRLISAALELHRKDSTIYVDDVLGEKLDLVSFNEYAGWYWSTPDEISKYNWDIKYNKPVVISELGGSALAGFHADKSTRWSEEYQDNLFKNQFKLLGKIDGLRGMTPWILVDFRSPRRAHSVYQNFWNRKGLISNTGQKKLAFYTLKNYYDKISETFNQKNR
ncbi:beta galactosidase jelly roll domain-containing protein [Pedobacter sp. SD-b]|uniref:Beta-glucuronidase n=1 Tax=Pedobacter segetis TaxID=2793069 RepID=A0ABS1BLY8_9SPHI|nr:glycoside hydrolase family 2 TIM barrel-domain containing protein [Pedobacter segetis]MBK0383915.1 beta galactosidase jelly roll domain-containing protein [Pedobacter segetis]